MNLLSWNLALRASVLCGDQNSSGASGVALVHYCRDRCLTLVLPDDASLLRLVDEAPRCLHILASQSYILRTYSMSIVCDDNNPEADTRRCFRCWSDFFFCFGFVLAPDARQSGSFSALSKPLEKIGSLDNLPRVTITAGGGRQVLRYSPEMLRQQQQRCWYVAKATRSSTLVGKRFLTRPGNARTRVNLSNPPAPSHVNSNGGQDGDVNCCDTLVVCEEGPSVVTNSSHIFGDITPDHDAAVSAIAQDTVCFHSVSTQHLLMTINGLADEHMRLVAATAIAGGLQGDQSMFSRIYQLVCDALLLTSPVDIMRQRQSGAPLTNHAARLVHGVRRARNRALNSGDAILSLEQRLSPLTENEAAALFGNRLVGCVRKIDEIAAGSSCCRPQTTSRCGLDQLWSWRDVVHTVIRELASPLPRRQAAQTSPAVGKQHDDIAADDLVPALVYCILSSSISAEAITTMMFHMQHAVRQESFAKRYSELLLDRICVDAFLDGDKLPNSVSDCLANGMYDEEDYLVVTLEVCLEYIASL